jgi:hypothetical protein
MTLRRLVLVAGLALLLAAPAARADGDPASDVLYTQRLFVPFNAPISTSVASELDLLIAAANRSGYPLKVALIGNAYDLGAVGGLWRRPQEYARFLGYELTFLYHGRLLIVMPNGFGLSWGKHKVAKELALLRPIPIGKGDQGLAVAAIAAVRRLAAAGGHPLAAPSSSSSGGGGSTTVVVGAAAGGVALCVLLGLLALRARARRRAVA